MPSNGDVKLPKITSKMEMDDSRLTPVSRLLTKNELAAFHEAFAVDFLCIY